MVDDELTRSHDLGATRCLWACSSPDYICYHDNEWGRPVVNDVRLFEKICLEGFQAGLSWITILRKRENFRAAFAGFDPVKLASFGEPDVARTLKDVGIVRHQGKIRSVLNNAKRALETIDEYGSLAAYFWSWEPRETAPYCVDQSGPHSASSASFGLAENLKKRGWSFVGPTTIYAFMQAMGLVNDHHPECFARVRCEVERATLVRPTRA